MTFGQIMEEKRNAIPKPFVLRKQIEEFLTGYKTVGAKKTAMGKEIKELIYFITSLQEQFNRKDKPSIAWHMGIQYTKHDLRNAANNLSILLEIKASLN